MPAGASTMNSRQLDADSVIEALYNAILQRQPDPGGHRYKVDLLASAAN